MRPASDSILSAIEQTEIGEDRLTEVLACVAHVNHRFAAELVRMAGVTPREGERYVVGTQRVTPAGRRVDMEIATHRGLARTGLVWIEVKAGAPYQPKQLSDYAEQVRDRAHGEPAGAVLTIIQPDDLPQPDPRPGPPRWQCRTWADVALTANRLGREWGRAAGQHRWRHAAMQPSAPAQWRYLAELVRRLEKEGYARMQPLTPEDVVAAPRVVTLRKTLSNLLRAASDLDGVTSQPDTFKSHREGSYQVYDPPNSAWFTDRDRFGYAYPELHYWFTDEWVPDPRDAPAFFAGITFYKPTDDTRYELRDEKWRDSLPAGVTVGGRRDVIRVVRTKYLSELVVSGSTLEEQTRALKLWANEALADLLDPAQVKAPDRRLDGPGDDEEAEQDGEL